MAFPVGAAPSYYAQITGATRNNTWYVGETAITFTLSQATATTYTVRDFYGATVVTGAVTGTALTLAVPSGGWKPGWYRLYLTGASTDANYGPSYGVTNFQVLRPDSHFPTMPARSTYGGHNSSVDLDLVARSVCSLGPQRYACFVDAFTQGYINEIITNAGIEQTYWQAYADGVRPRELLCQLPNGGYDVVGIGGLRFFPKVPGDAKNPNIYCQISAGSVSGFKVTIAYPNSSTIVETWDNVADTPAARAAENGTSQYVTLSGAGAIGIGGPTALSNTFYNGVKDIVSQLYPAGITWFEGPTNEPSEGNGGEGTTTQEMRCFYAAVKAGNVNAKVLGPNHVNEQYGGLNMQWFLASGGGAYCDGLSFHAYNMMLGDINLARYTMDGFKATLDSFAAVTAGKPLWQTEQGVFTPVYGVYHPRRARWQLMQLLIQEQYGILKERNHMWYDLSHGFWSQPTWTVNLDQSVNPQATLTRVLAEETYARSFEAKLDFGEPGNHLFIGSSYLKADGTRTLALLAGSPLDDPSVVLQLAGTGVPGTVTISDGFGNVTTVTVDRFKRITVNVPDLPLYVRLPASCTATVYQHGTWPPLSSPAKVNLARSDVVYSGIVSVSGAARYGSAATIANGTYQQTYGYDGSAQFMSADFAPGVWAQVRWANPATFDRVVIWSGFAWQANCALLDFDIQTSPDGSTWTTRTTVTKTASSFRHGSDSNGTGTSTETYWNEQWIFDVPLPARVTAKYVRVYVRATSPGGAPDAAAVAAGDQPDDGNMRLTIAEMAVYGDHLVTPRYI